MPPDEKDPPPRATAEQVRAYVESPQAQGHLRNVVAGALGRRATRSLVDDLCQDAQVVAITAEELADSAESIAAWVDGIARNVVREHFAAKKKEEGVFDPRGSEELEDLPFVYEPTDEDASDWRVGKWLRKQVAKVPREKEVFEILEYKARSKKTYAAIAAERGMSLASLSNRIYRLKEKYEPLWQEEKRDRQRTLLWAIAVGAVILMLAFAMWALRRPKIEALPAPDFELRPVPSASASAAPPEEFMPALPPPPTPEELKEKEPGKPK